VAVSRAIQVAVDNDAWLRVVHASREQLAEDDRARIRSLSDMLRALTPPELHAHLAVIRNDPVDGILEEIVTFEPDLIVLGAHKRARLRDALFGTTAAQLLARARVPILIAHQAECRPYRRILAAIDSDSTAEPVLRLATRVGSARHLFVVHARRARPDRHVTPGSEVDPESRSALERIVLKAAPRSDELQVHLDVRDGDPFRVIEREVRQIEPDLLVLGTHGRQGVARILFDSLAEDALAYFDLDMLVVRVAEEEDAASDQALPVAAASTVTT
jgi:nucleotide-binding universal stress UspA family protein